LVDCASYHEERPFSGASTALWKEDEAVHVLLGWLWGCRLVEGIKYDQLYLSLDFQGMQAVIIYIYIYIYYI